MLKKHLYSAVVAIGVFSSSQAIAAGELNIFNWGNYTSPELIEKFEKTYDIKVMKKYKQMQAEKKDIKRE